MFCLRRRYRKPIAAFVAACWVFALAASVVHACGLDEDLGYANQAEAMSMAGGGKAHDCAQPGCREFCANDVSVVAKLKLVQDQASAQPLLISLPSVQPTPTSEATVGSLSRSPDPPPLVAVNIHFVRLAL